MILPSLKDAQLCIHFAGVYLVQVVIIFSDTLIRVTMVVIANVQHRLSGYITALPLPADLGVSTGGRKMFSARDRHASPLRPACMLVSQARRFRGLDYYCPSIWSHGSDSILGTIRTDTRARMLIIGPACPG